MIAGGNGYENPNVDYLQSRGFYFFYLLFIAVYHLILLSLPFIDVQMAWTLTNLTHNAANLFFLHILKGTPWITPIDDCKRETHYEQISSYFGTDAWTEQKKFLTTFPIILFLLTCLYTRNSETHFICNLISLVVVTLPKLPSFHRVRLFNINKY